MKSYQAIAAAAIALQGAEARMWFGECPKVEWDTGFDHARFAGKWYEQERDSMLTMDMGQMCTTGGFNLRDDGLLDVQFRTLVPMDFMQYVQSPVMKMDCSKSFECEYDIEGYDKDDEKKDKNF